MGGELIIQLIPNEENFALYLFIYLFFMPVNRVQAPESCPSSSSFAPADTVPAYLPPRELIPYSSMTKCSS